MGTPDKEGLPVIPLPTSPFGGACLPLPSLRPCLAQNAKAAAAAVQSPAEVTDEGEEITEVWGADGGGAERWLAGSSGNGLGMGPTPADQIGIALRWFQGHANSMPLMWRYSAPQSAAQISAIH